MFTALCLGIGLIGASPAEGASPGDDRAAYEAALETLGRDPEAHIRLALWCEAHGLKAEQVKHLALAVLMDPKNATARGLMGLVAYRGQWQRPEAVAARVKADEDLSARLAEYNARRGRLRETADAHWELALWCERNGLDAEARAHLTAVTRLAPAREAVWKRLGCKKVGNRWVTETQLAAERDEAETRKEADRAWKPLLTKWRSWLVQEEHRAEAEQALAAVTDPYAVASVWEVFGRQGTRLQLLAVQVFGQIDAAASSRALAVLASAGRSNEVRLVASQVLRRRDPREYVGFLLSRLRKPIRYATGITLGPDGYYHRVLHVEGKTIDTETTYEGRIGAPGKPLGYPDLPARMFTDDIPFDPYGYQFGPPSFGPAAAQTLQALVAHPHDAARIVAGAAAGSGATGPVHLPAGASAAAGRWAAHDTVAAARARDRQIAAQLSRPPADSWRFRSAVQSLESTNAAIRQANTAIFTALNRSTEQDLPEDPEPWREWYYDVQGYAYTRPQTVERPRFTAFLSMPSCFAAGTPVETIDGLRPIEKIRVGDQVLAQDTRTGALNFRAVTAVHHNPPGETLGVRIGDEVIAPSIFHRFWRAGQGWAMARDLKPGDEIRSYGGRPRVTSVAPEGVQPVFNLDVAEDHTFFVGRGAFLVHDNTLPELRLAPFDAAPDLTAIAQATTDGDPRASAQPK